MKLNKKTWSIAALVVVVFLIAWKINRASSSADPRRIAAQLVQVDQPRHETVLYTLSYTGDILPIQQANIFARVGGNLDRVSTNIGDEVRQGQLLALIDTTELVQQVQQASATYENAKINYERIKELSGQNLVAKQDLDNADAGMKVAKANNDLARTRLAYAYISAPFGGIITKRYFDQGANITSNDKVLFTLMDASVMKVIVSVLEKDIPLMTAGKKAVITVDAYPGKEFYGAVKRFSGAVDLSTRTMDVEIDIPNKDRLLKPGMFANVSLIVDEHKNALTIPTQALLKDDKGSYVYTVDGAMTHRKNIKSGAEQNNRMEVLSGLEETEKIIVVGQQFVKDSGQVIIQQ